MAFIFFSFLNQQNNQQFSQIKRDIIFIHYYFCLHLLLLINIIAVNERKFIYKKDLQIILMKSQSTQKKIIHYNV